MSMVIRVGGVPYDNFISGNVEIRLDVLCNTFTFVMARSQTDPLPFNLGDSCEILVNGTLVLTGTIEVMTITYSANVHEIQLAGRDNTSDLLDSSIGELSDIAEGASLKTIIEQVLNHIKSNVSVVDVSNPENFNEVNDVASPEPGTNAFSFIEPLSRQRQVLLTSNGDGNVVITQGSGDVLEGAKIQNTLANNGDNNVLNVTASYDNTGRYNIYSLSSQGNPSSLESSGVVDLDSIIDREGGTIDTGIRTGRQLVLSAESAFSDSDDFNRVRWEANIRKARGRLYTAEVYQYSIDANPNNGNLWEVNKLVQVVDDFAGINANLLINGIIFSLSVDSGSTTKITFVEPDAYSLALEEPVIGVGF